MPYILISLPSGASRRNNSPSVPFHRSIITTSENPEKKLYIHSYWAFCCKGTGVALQILIIALGSPGCIYLTAPERWLYQHFEIFKHCIVKEETTEGWKTLKYSLNLNRWPSLEVHHWALATILRFLTAIWLLPGMHAAAFFASGRGGAGQKKKIWGWAGQGVKSSPHFPIRNSEIIFKKLSS